jgi:hypothetical protein
MSIRATCPHCDETHQLPDRLRGRSTTCRVCEREFDIPDDVDDKDEPERDSHGLQRQPNRQREQDRPSRRMRDRAMPQHKRTPSAAGTAGTNRLLWIALGGAVLILLTSVLVMMILLSDSVSGGGNRPQRVPAQAVPFAVDVADPCGPAPFPLDDRLKMPGKVFLSDLPEFAWKKGPNGWSFGKNGQLGSIWVPGGTVRVNGQSPDKALSMHPPDTGYTRICYDLGRCAATLHGAVAISEDEAHSRPNPTRFLILGDDKVLWRSDAIAAHRATQEFTVDVSQVTILELRVYVEGGRCFGSHAAWLDPFVLGKE